MVDLHITRNLPHSRYLILPLGASQLELEETLQVAGIDALRRAREV